MKKILSLLSAFTLIICLSSFTKEVDLVKCETVQTVTITNNSSCAISGFVVGQHIINFLGSGATTGPLSVTGSSIVVCIDENSNCNVSVTIVHSMIEECENNQFPNSSALICSSTKEIEFEQGGEAPSCATFSCLTPFGG
jgi:hypothetical protein